MPRVNSLSCNAEQAMHSSVLSPAGPSGHRPVLSEQAVNSGIKKGVRGVFGKGESPQQREVLEWAATTKILDGHFSHKCYKRKKRHLSLEKKEVQRREIPGQNNEYSPGYCSTQRTLSRATNIFGSKLVQNIYTKCDTHLPSHCPYKYCRFSGFPQTPTEY